MCQNLSILFPSENRFALEIVEMELNEIKKKRLLQPMINVFGSILEIEFFFRTLSFGRSKKTKQQRI